MGTRFCPRCAIQLQVRTTQQIEVDVCESCGGVWLDEGEFDQLIARKFIGSNVEVGLAFAGQDTPDGVGCPDGHGAMQAIPFDAIELDRCKTCKGIWVDGFERSHFPDMAERQRALRANDDVSCSGCDAEVRRRHSINRAGLFFCEQCVVRGNYPQSDSDQHHRGNARLSLAKAKMKQQRRQYDAQERSDQFRSGTGTFWWWGPEFALIEFIAQSIRGWREDK